MSAPQYFIAKVTQLDQYVVLQGATVVSGPHASAALAVKAKNELLKAAHVAAGNTSAERVAET